jgi:hypothetical protein
MVVASSFGNLGADEFAASLQIFRDLLIRNALLKLAPGLLDAFQTRFQ